MGDYDLEILEQYPQSKGCFPVRDGSGSDAVKAGGFV